MKLAMSPKRRNFVWENGQAFFPVTDTAWALPYRATHDEVREYAQMRRSQGFSAALLMVFQPDTRAEGPDDRMAIGGFARAFRDHEADHIREMIPEYFEHLDGSIAILRENGIVPMLAPLFYGFGWQGKRVSGPLIPPGEAADFARFLVDRYSDGPSIWIVGADGTGREPAVAAMGKAIRDRCSDPIGIHYNPWETNDAHAGADWLDFQLGQTGHWGEHRPEVPAVMFANENRGSVARQAVGNGEPTYEGMSGFGMGEWQSDEAWGNLMVGGTVGTFYGAASLWQWKRTGEALWGTWCAGDWDWRDAMDLPGAAYPGVLGRILDRYAFADMEPRIEVARGKRCLAVLGRLALVHLPDGGGFDLAPWQGSLPWTAFDARSGERVASGQLGPDWDDPHMGSRIETGRRSPTVVAVGEPIDQPVT